MWVITFFVVFSLPSQRDERYLLPAMPALAVLCALNWERISGRAFTASSWQPGWPRCCWPICRCDWNRACQAIGSIRRAIGSLLTATVIVVLASLAGAGAVRAGTSPSRFSWRC